MTEINAKGLSRRAFFGLGATGAAVAGLTGCSPAPQSDAAAPATTGDTTMPATGTATYEWEIAPEPITDIASTVDTDILVIGAGLSGCACAAAAAEKGGKVTVVEKTGSFNGRGGGFGAINSRYMEAQNIVVDKVNAKQHWIAQCASRTNEDLIVKFFNNSEEASNWLIDKCEALGGSAMVGAFYSHDDVYAEQPGYHMFMIPEEAGLTSTGFAGAELCYLDAVKDGAEFVFDSPAVQLVKDDSGKVCGCICETSEGYVQYNAAKGVVLATGGFGRDLEFRLAQDPRLDETVDCTNQEGATAESLKAAVRAGAMAVHTDWIQLLPFMSPDEQGYGVAAFYTDGQASYAPTLCRATGRRVVNELTDRKRYADAILETGEPCVQITCKKAMYGEGLENAMKAGITHEFNSLEEAAA